MNCNACGTDNAPGNRFCNTCGAPLASLCAACGHPNPAEAQFCGSCGTALGAQVGAPIQATPATGAGVTQASAERRLVSVVFSDLVGFTTFAEDRDPEAVRELLSRYFDTATEIVQRHGGTVEKFIGDAVMAVWGTPVAHEDDAERAVRAALEVVDAVKALQPDLQARAGVLTGDAAVTLNAQNQGMVAGDLVNTAARLQGVAEPGTVLVGEPTMRATESAIVFEPIGDHALKGKTTPVPAWQALRVVAQRGGQGRADTLEAPFVGRDEELRQLKDVLHAVGRERRPRLVSITGTGGIGKSRLVWELEKYVDGVAELIYWHRGRSPSYGEGITFWALGEMVRRRAQLTEDDDEATTRERITLTLDEYVDDASERERIGPALLSLLGVEDAPEGGRDALFPAWRLFFERIAERGTTVLVFEDLQWADTGLLDFIDHLRDWSRGLPIMVVTLARPELFDKRPDWGAGRRHLTALALEPLTDAAVREMLNGLVPGLPEDALAAIVGRAEGVPLYAVETVRGLLADGRIERQGEVYAPVGDLSRITVPDSLRSLIASRLDALDPVDRGLLQDAAVLGQVFGTDALAAVHGTDPAELEPRLRDLVRRELLDVERDPSSPERGQHKFVQSLIREVAYGTLARRDRRARHLAVARHYEGIGDEELAGALASHYLSAHAASEPGAEVDAVAAQARLALRAAAERAAGLGGHDQAVSYLEQALAVTDDLRDRGELLAAAAVSAGMAAREEATGYAGEAVDIYVELGDRVAAARTSALHGRLLLDAGQMKAAGAVLREALVQVEELDAPEVEAELAATLARVHMRTAEYPETLTTADRSLSIAERLNLEDVVAEALINKGAALGLMGRRREGISLLETAVGLAARGSVRSREMRGRVNLASQLGDDDPRRSMEEMERTLALARDLGDRSHYNWLVASLTIARWSAGEHWDEQIALSREALETSTMRVDRARIRVLLGAIETTRGENLDEVVAEIDGILGETTHADELLTKAMSRASTALVRDRLDEAYHWGMTAAGYQTQVPEAGLSVAARAAIWLRDADRLRPVVERVLSLPSSGAMSLAFNARDTAALAALEGRRDEALEGFRLAQAEMRRFEQWFEFAAFALDAISVLPDQPEVRSWAHEARAIFERLRARPYLERLDAALGSTGPDSAAAMAPSSAEVPAPG